jgi:hypothetical protein
VSATPLKRRITYHAEANDVQSLLHEYQQSIQEMVLRPKTQEEIDAAAAGGEYALAWL